MRATLVALCLAASALAQIPASELPLAGHRDAVSLASVSHVLFEASSETWQHEAAIVDLRGASVGMRLLEAMDMTNGIQPCEPVQYVVIRGEPGNLVGQGWQGGMTLPAGSTAVAIAEVAPQMSAPAAGLDIVLSPGHEYHLVGVIWHDYHLTFGAEQFGFRMVRDEPGAGASMASLPSLPSDREFDVTVFGWTPGAPLMFPAGVSVVVTEFVQLSPAAVAMSGIVNPYLGVYPIAPWAVGGSWSPTDGLLLRDLLVSNSADFRVRGYVVLDSEL